MYGLLFNYLKTWNQKVQKKQQHNEEFAFKFVQMKFLVMYIANQKLSYIFMCRTITKYLYGTWSLFNTLMIFWYKRKIYNFDPYNVLLAI